MSDLKEEIKEILKENACEMCCSDSYCTQDYVRVDVTIDKVVELVLKVVNDESYIKGILK